MFSEAPAFVGDRGSPVILFLYVCVCVCAFFGARFHFFFGLFEQAWISF